ncbi:MAG: hypothetical protein J6U74_05710, partial [Clostridia bacterium]|nr:hypothetical protein [Clostridia bacterium]
PHKIHQKLNNLILTTKEKLLACRQFSFFSAFYRAIYFSTKIPPELSDILWVKILHFECHYGKINN